LKFAQRPRALRKPFVAAIVITDMASERQMSARTSDLSVHGCFVTTPTPSNPGAKVRVTIVHAGAKIVALGHVVSTHAEGMGIAFTNIEPGDQAVLELWMSDLRVK
jgi:PilZ domain